jgi:hypothetical protein
MKLDLRESSDIIGQRGFGQADKFVAVYTAILLKAIFRPNIHLSRKTQPFRVDGSANNS